MFFPKPSEHRVRLPIGTVVLLMAVFGWGLEYKTSLYQEPGNIFHSRSLPPAKLLTEAERTLSSKQAAFGYGLNRGAKFASSHLLAAGWRVDQTACEGWAPYAYEGETPERSFAAKFFIRPPPLS
jgi:hypothetical protein